MLTNLVFYANLAILILFFASYAYQAFYLLVGLFKKEKVLEPKGTPGRYAVLIPARNEEAVIDKLLESLEAQDYPAGLLDIYVIADNCTDGTAQRARMHPGVDVLERHSSRLVGKGYALDAALAYLPRHNTGLPYDGYFVFDADNVLDPNFVKEMDRTFRSGYPVVTSYRNSKNYGSNWISAGYALWFLRESRFLNGARTKLGLNCAISGTGFLVSAKLLQKAGGWKRHLLTEDIEFSVDNAIHHNAIGYCPRAVLYDEQPVCFGESWNQRLRWSKGFYQVVRRYGSRLVRGATHKKGFSCYDMLMTIAPATLLTLAMLLFNSGALAYAVWAGKKYLFFLTLFEVTNTLLSIYFSLFLFGLITTITEWSSIHCSGWKKIVYLFTFPVFILTYIPIAVAALRRNVTWKPIRHSIACSSQDICAVRQK